MDAPYLEIFSVIMFFISLLGLITSNNIVKSIILILMMQTAVIMFWLTIGRGAHPPIIHDLALLDHPQLIADPLPQTLMLTAIIIGISVGAVIITMLNTVFRRFRTTDWKTLERIEDGIFKAEVYEDHLPYQLHQ